MPKNTVGILSVIALALCACTSESHLPFDAISSSMSVPEELIGNWLTGENGN